MDSGLSQCFIPSVLTLLTLTLGPCWGRWWMVTAGRSRDGWCGGPEGIWREENMWMAGPYMSQDSRFRVHVLLSC